MLAGRSTHSLLLCSLTPKHPHTWTGQQIVGGSSRHMPALASSISCRQHRQARRRSERLLAHRGHAIPHGRDRHDRRSAVLETCTRTATQSPPLTGCFRQGPVNTVCARHRSCSSRQDSHAEQRVCYLLLSTVRGGGVLARCMRWRAGLRPTPKSTHFLCAGRGGGNSRGRARSPMRHAARRGHHLRSTMTCSWCKACCCCRVSCPNN